MFQLHPRTTVDSTNHEALRQWRRAVDAGDPAPIMVWADRQTAGRGRMDRPWQSPEGGLWMSLAWPIRGAVEHYRPLPLVVGLTVAETLHQLCQLDVSLKWPNDLIHHDRKLAGVLCQLEPRGDHPVAIAGIGLNANFPASALGSALRQPATTMLDILGKEVHLQTLRIALIARLQYRLTQFDRAGLTPVSHALRRRLAWRGRDVVIDMPDHTTLRGNLIGLDFDGHLLIRTHDDRRGVQSLTVGEIRHLSPADAPFEPEPRTRRPGRLPGGRHGTNLSPEQSPTPARSLPT